jgi:AcrR family transcriptional regulator
VVGPARVSVDKIYKSSDFIRSSIVLARTTVTPVTLSDVSPSEDATRAGKGERTRARLLGLAIARFAAQGYRGTSVSDVARDAGLTPAAVYAYFTGKAGLFEAAVDADAAALIEEAGAEAAGSPIGERELRFVAALVDRVDAHPLARRVLAGLEPEVLPRLLRLPSLDASTSGCAVELADGQRLGEIRADVDPAVMAKGLETIVLALLMGHVQSGAGDDPARVAGVAAVLDAALRAPRA